MALVICKNCGKEVSTHLITCSNCGTPIGYSGGTPVDYEQIKASAKPDTGQRTFSPGLSERSQLPGPSAQATGGQDQEKSTLQAFAALTVTCIGCGREVSKHLIACPECGTPIGYSGGTPVDYAPIKASGKADTAQRSFPSEPTISYTMDKEAFLTRLFDPRGRSTRSQYALALFGSLGVGLLLVLILLELGELLALLLIPVWIIAHIRRLHDRRQSGWLVLLLLIPFIGFLWLLYLLFSPSITSNDREG